VCRVTNTCEERSEAISSPSWRRHVRGHSKAGWSVVQGCSLDTRLSVPVPAAAPPCLVGHWGLATCRDLTGRWSMAGDGMGHSGVRARPRGQSRAGPGRGAGSPDCRRVVRRDFVWHDVTVRTWRHSPSSRGAVSRGRSPRNAWPHRAVARPLHPPGVRAITNRPTVRPTWCGPLAAGVMDGRKPSLLSASSTSAACWDLRGTSVDRPAVAHVQAWLISQ